MPSEVPAMAEPRYAGVPQNGGIALFDSDDRYAAFVPDELVRAAGGPDAIVKAANAVHEWSREGLGRGAPGRPLSLWAGKGPAGRTWRIGDLEGTGDTFAAVPRGMTDMRPSRTAGMMLDLLERLNAIATGGVPRGPTTTP